MIDIDNENGTKNNEDELRLIVSLIHFVIVLDNKGKRLYAKYYPNQIPYMKDFNKESKQKELEAKIFRYYDIYELSKEEIEVFSLDDFCITGQISNEVGLFIGSSNADNFSFLSIVYETIEALLCKFIDNGLTINYFLENYAKFVILIDEMINDDGIVMNLNRAYLEQSTELNNVDIVKMIEQKTSQEGSLLGSIFSGARGYFSK